MGVKLMETLWNAVKALSVWQALALLAVMGGAAAGVYALYARSSAPPAAAAELTENEQIVPVQYGDIINQVSTNGNLDFPERETVFFRGKGTLGQLLAVEGQSVRQGEVLARLDAAAIVALEESVAQARFDLLQAQDALQDLQETPDAAQYALDRAAAIQKVAEARFKLHQAREALADLLAPELPTAEDVKRQEEKIADARLKLQQAKESRDNLLNPESPTAAEIKQQEEKVADARLKLQQAITDRDDFISRNRRPDYALKVAELDQGRADAAKELAEIQEALDALSPTEKQLVEARQAVQKAQSALDAAEQALENFKDRHGSTLITRRQEKEELESRLNRAKATLAELQADYDKGVLGLYANIQRWRQFIALWEPELEDLRRGLAGQVEELELAVEVAAAALQEARDNLAELEQGPDAREIQALEAKAAAILAQQEVADRDRAELETPEVDPVELALKEAQIALAEATLQQAIADLDELQDTAADPVELALKEAQIALAEATLQQAIIDLDELQGDLREVPEPTEVALKEKDIALAQATLDKAEQELADLTPPESADPLEVALKKAEIATARVQLQDALTQLDAATLRAPLAGVVMQVKAAVGDAVESDTEIMEIVDTGIVEVDGIVDEIDVLSVSVGTAAEVMLDALPEEILVGVVTEIADEAENQQGIVTYKIRIRLEAPEGVELQAGLSAIANIILREERNVLVVPQQALYGSVNQPTVRALATDGRIEERPVRLGSRDDFWVAVSAGLAAGDRVVMEAAEGAFDPFGGSGFRQIRRASGGGRGPRN